MDIITIVGSVILLIIVVSIIAVFFIFLDLMSYVSRGTKSLVPASKSRGNVMVAYNPGLSGAAKNAADFIANELKSRDYNVDLTGIRSDTASNTSNYDIVIVGGPMYFGKATKSIETYLKTAKLPGNIKIGIFTTTGASEFNEEDMASLEKQVTSLLGKKAVTRTLRSGDNTKIDCKDFLSAVLQ